MEDKLNSRLELNQGELNQFVSIYLVLTSIGSVINSIASGIGRLRILESGSEYLAYILILGTVINAFVVIYFIVYKKDIIGVWLFFGLLFIELIMLLSLYGESSLKAIIWAVSRVVVLSLVLLLRKNGESAWKTLSRRVNKIDEVEELDDEYCNPIWKYITYTLTGILVLVMIIAVIVQYG